MVVGIHRGSMGKKGSRVRRVLGAGRGEGLVEVVEIVGVERFG